MLMVLRLIGGGFLVGVVVGVLGCLLMLFSVGVIGLRLGRGWVISRRLGSLLLSIRCLARRLSWLGSRRVGCLLGGSRSRVIRGWLIMRLWIGCCCLVLVLSSWRWLWLGGSAWRVLRS